MQIEKLSNNIETKKYLTELGVDGAGVNILASKMTNHIIYIRDLHVGAANILKQDALSIGADLAVPKGTIVAETPLVDCILIATTAQLKTLSKKELAQPFGLKILAKKLDEFIKIKKAKKIEIMGVINANDDSFFSSSRFVDSDAIFSIEKMIEDGADIIDIGGVSSAPNSKLVDAKEELRRVKPILQAIKEQKLYERVNFSIDSYEPLVVEQALDSGFKIVNDITGLANDEICKLVANYNARAIIMHMQGTPQTMQIAPKYENIISDMYTFFEQRIEKAESFGVKDISLDVGIGFGKTLEQNLQLIKHLEHFLTLNKPILVGASRKSMIDQISKSLPKDRLAGTLALHLEAIRNGASIIRVHDVAEHIQAIKIKQALDAI
ncbi:dihydropteroate synthase [Sulfurimonas gotlandica GD1]|jgi:dihydropteroate synthase|uniref:dihydropteroate synthase n=1 Tax=Sulfurimonas gotlandica (strain DSM 19862 / JCM 16533 / GD1) TaxID=929558 RepID=B6BIP0_SULGG|nr:dihydropteroate synthase [Sulfurimonas gotlandica]EDZ63362.1 dihydropteroate synthase [Sulfurimonas gotlandica GD1]EHP30398.1 dihydropteroate synthase [Sulfurimonas gotlandica GD1]